MDEIDQRVVGLTALLKRRGPQEGSIRCVRWACLVDEAYVRPTGRVHLHVVRLQGVKGGVNGGRSAARRTDRVASFGAGRCSAGGGRVVGRGIKQKIKRPIQSNQLELHLD